MKDIRKSAIAFLRTMRLLCEQIGLLDELYFLLPEGSGQRTEKLVVRLLDHCVEIHKCAVRNNLSKLVNISNCTMDFPRHFFG